MYFLRNTSLHVSYIPLKKSIFVSSSNILIMFKHVAIIYVIIWTKYKIKESIYRYKMLTSLFCLWQKKLVFHFSKPIIYDSEQFWRDVTHIERYNFLEMKYIKKI